MLFLVSYADFEGGNIVEKNNAGYVHFFWSVITIISLSQLPAGISKERLHLFSTI